MSNDIAMSHKDIATFALFVAASGFISGYALGTSDHSGKEAVIEQYQSWSLQEQQDFILSVIKEKHSLRREIAEDWCSINGQTQRVCWNSRLHHPIRGVK